MRALMLILLVAVSLGCYDHVHPPVTPGDPTAYPPLTDDAKKPDGGR